MPRKRKRRSRVDDTMRRNVVITQVAPSIRFAVEEPKGPDPDIEARQWLELRGRATEPLRDVRDVVLSSGESRSAPIICFGRRSDPQVVACISGGQLGDRSYRFSCVFFSLYLNGQRGRRQAPSVSCERQRKAGLYGST